MTEVEQTAYDHAWDVAKSLQTQVNILEEAMKYIAFDETLTDEDMVATAQGCLRTLKLHRES